MRALVSLALAVALNAQAASSALAQAGRAAATRTVPAGVVAVPAFAPTSLPPGFAVRSADLPPLETGSFLEAPELEALPAAAPAGLAPAPEAPAFVRPAPAAREAAEDAAPASKAKAGAARSAGVSENPSAPAPESRAQEGRILFDGSVRLEGLGAASPAPVAARAARGEAPARAPPSFAARPGALRFSAPARLSGERPSRRRPGAWSLLRKAAGAAVLGALMLSAPIASAQIFGPLYAALGLAPYPFLDALLESGSPYGLPLMIGQFALGLVTVVAGARAFGRVLERHGIPFDEYLLPAALAGVGLVFLGGFLGAPALGLPAIAAGSFFVTMVMATGEEAVFRGFLFERLRRLLRGLGPNAAFWLAALPAAALFSLAHVPVHGFTWNLFVLKALLGLFFTGVYRRTGSVAAAGAVHGFYNLSVPLLAALMPAVAAPSLLGVHLAVLAAVGLTIALLPRKA